MSGPARRFAVPWAGMTGVASAIGTMIVVTHLRLLDGAAGRWFAAALVVLLYGAFCLVIFMGQRRRRHAAQRWQSDQDVGPAQTMLVVFASQTGYAEQLALQTAAALQQAHISVRLVCLGQLDLAQLQDARRALFIVSTTGEGDAPDAAAGFALQVMGQAAMLDTLQYGMLALGDRSYARYCAFGHACEQWLRHHGAQAMFDTVEVDNGDAGALRHWQHHVGQLSGHAESADWRPVAFSRWVLTTRRQLNPDSVGAPAFHLALQPMQGEEATHAFDWQAGDIAEIAPCNAPATVQAFLDVLQLDGAQSVLDDAQAQTLATVLGRRQLPQAPAALAALRSLSAQALADRLEPLSSRDYSIASLPQDGSLELLVRQTRLPDGTLGLGSGWLTAHLPENGAVQLRVRENRSFHPPVDDRPLMLIGNGTGMAGLRAHLKARAHAGRTRNWLLFGERSAQHDYFYRQEIERWLAQGVVQRVDLAFSRDQAQRLYVQDKLREAAATLQQWVDEGAAIYVCGRMEGMAAGVTQTLQDILGVARLSSMVDQGRYRRDVY